MATKRTPRLRSLAVFLLFGLTALACGGGTQTVAEPAAPSEDGAAAETAEAPDPGLFAGDFVDLNGESIDFASFEGQDTVLWFWAPW